MVFDIVTTKPLTRLAQGLVLVAASALMGVAVPGAIHAEDARQWIGDSQEGIASLLYGIPQSDDAPVAFRCELPARDFFVTLSLPPDFEPKAGSVRLAITAPPTGEDVQGDAEIQFLQEMDVTFLEAKLAFDVAIARMLKQGSELRFTIGEKAFVYPLAGAAEAMGQIEAACAKPT